VELLAQERRKSTGHSRSRRSRPWSSCLYLCPLLGSIYGEGSALDECEPAEAGVEDPGDDSDGPHARGDNARL
jgi:hypothetical protein